MGFTIEIGRCLTAGAASDHWDVMQHIYIYGICSQIAKLWNSLKSETLWAPGFG